MPGFACLGEEAWSAAINVGLPPTFKGVPGSAKLEANIVGFSADIYERDIALSFTKQLRRSRPVPIRLTSLSRRLKAIFKMFAISMVRGGCDELRA